MKHHSSIITRLSSLALAALLLGACHGDALPEGVLEPERMEAFLSEAYLLEARYAVGTNYCYDSVNPEALQAYDDLLERMDLSRETVEASLQYYTNHPDIYAEINDGVVKLLEQKTSL